ncbi:FAD-dependent oxidoreductase [Flammeovirga yaeyamensis]|uniref:FAD-dependent oxidoreductase n=1 Tax=Flammeovirga yaeyamensis TaxID=367791 RepID=A0AAX1NFL9_9BACT|nr:FAD-dependent oxidoreductase [Flammeovirga yaeyamensis]MBB3697039.1 FAD/FMN-containing dehydrogenase [Flammeovirga yaeyamensis]QWG05033.1 FAD-dependent oxidoreductase [Flammeovirga yaeyamensis]
MKLTVKLIQFLFRLPGKFFKFIHRKKRYTIPFYAFVVYIISVIIIIKTAGDPTFDKILENKLVNDITQLNPIQVSNVVQPSNVEDIINAIQSTTGPISVGGGRYSMGGQVAFDNSLHIDMRQFNQVLNLDTEKKQITVQPGITWRDLQNYIDPYDLSVKIMQTYANFTVGGSISVNCHGRYIGHGPIISSVLNIKLVTSEGKLITANRTENSDIFNAAIGGYGGIGTIVETTLQLEKNVKVERQTNLVEVKDYLSFFNENIRNNKKVIFQNGDLYPPHFNEVNNVAWVETDKELTDTIRVTPTGLDYSLEHRLLKVVSWGNFGKWIRRKIIDPYLYSNEVVTWRNKEASYDVNELEPKSRKESTYVLQEYFIPINNIESFIPKMKAVYDQFDVNVINVSLRHAYPDKESLLSWAPEEVIALVIYYKQGTSDEAKENVKQWTQAMTDAILSEGGTWYLPYQPHATVDQFNKGYPNASTYFSLKDSIDPQHRFNNKLLDKYNPYIANRIEKEGNNIKGYYRNEEQTILTVPEWYLVFNPKEYADYLASGANPSDFPFYASIDEYWSLYDRSLKLVSEAYPTNEEYITMLQVIGVSITLEYTIKIIYENTIGKVFSYLHNGINSDEEEMINQAHRAYSDFIYQTAWYEFDFLPWIGKVWSVSNTKDSNWLRKFERKTLFTFEFLLKAGYGKLIEWAATSTYEEPVTDIYVLATSSGEISTNNEVKVYTKKDNMYLLAIERWGAFTTNLIRLVDEDIQIHNIGGNDEILVSIIAPKDISLHEDKIQVLYKSNIVTDNSSKRFVYFMHVSELIPFIKRMKTKGIEIEHIFDY